MQFLDIKNGRFYLGDCLEVMKEIPDGVVDMLLVDLPYGTTACSWDSVIPFEPLWEQYNRICKENAAMVFTASQPFTTALIASNINNFRYEWIWQKNAGSNFAQTKYMPMKEHENILVFYRKRPVYNAQMQARSEKGASRTKYAVKMNSCGNGKGEAYGIKGVVTKNIKELRVPSSVQKFNRQRGLHPTQKPVELFEYLIRTYTNEGELVLDNTAGSGTTAIAAENTGRKWVCIEQLEEYATKAVERIKNHQRDEMPTNSGVKIDDSIPIPEGEEA